MTKNLSSIVKLSQKHPACCETVMPGSIAHEVMGTSSWMAMSFLFLLRFYQRRISPLLGPRCRFYPTCSEYACQCLEKFSLQKALGKITWRLLRCNQFSPGGVDQP